MLTITDIEYSKRRPGGFWLYLCIFICIGISLASHAERPAAEDRFTFSQTSTSSAYVATLKPQKGIIPIGQLHNWILHLETQAGEIFMPKVLVVQGGMPGHGHGFPVEPEVSRYLQQGNYLIEGVLFNMPGQWQLRFGVDGPHGWDTITFIVNVEATLDKTVGDLSGQLWSANQRALIHSFLLEKAGPVKADPSNRFDGNTLAIQLGKALFFDKQLSGSQQVSCATCHQPDNFFMDSKNLGFGSAQVKRNTPTLIGSARNLWQYWDGRRDSLWSQAITPLETRGEMDSTRTDVVRYFLSQPQYLKDYLSLADIAQDKIVAIGEVKQFPVGATPYAKGEGKKYWTNMSRENQQFVNRVFSDIGKLIAAYEATLDFTANQLDRYIKALNRQDPKANSLLTEAEKRGLALFIDIERSQCLRCHNGPLFTNQGFHNIGSALNQKAVMDYGRVFGLRAVEFDIFNCEGQYSDAKKDECKALRFALKQEVPAFFTGAFKVPSLRNVSKTAPYFHDGRYATLEEVVLHYAKPPVANGELTPVAFSEQELDDLIAFLNVL